MTWQVLIMYAVAALLVVIGAGMLLSLARPAGPARVYVFRMVGIMALAAGIVLGFSAWSMDRWSTDAPSPSSTPSPG
jgi:predicted tellurium resistance membrane protein TerC